MGEIIRTKELIIDSWVDRLTWQDAVDRIIVWARKREHRYVCVCNVHSVVSASRDERLAAAIDQADLATPDGMPIAWLMTRRAGTRQERINGPDLTIRLCEAAAIEGIPVVFFGSTERTLSELRQVLRSQFPALNVADCIAPPFGDVYALGDPRLIDRIRAPHPGIVFVGLGCPKQELWMHEQCQSMEGVLIGVGAAFDYIAGTVKRPPAWMQRSGLEWLGRMAAEPRRLWRRYLVTNTAFLLYCGRDLIRFRRRRSPKQ